MWKRHPLGEFAGEWKDPYGGISKMPKRELYVGRAGVGSFYGENLLLAKSVFTVDILKPIRYN